MKKRVEGEGALMMSLIYLIGDIIKLKKGEAVPADMVLLSTNQNKGVCYVETSSLDGYVQ